MATKKVFSNRTFIDCVRDYLPMNALVLETDAPGHAASRVSHDELRADTFYVFDGDTMLAICYAIEDLALEAAQGTLLATFRDFKGFEPYRERVAQLARTIDRVEILGSGRTPRGIPRVKFVRDARQACKEFCIVLFEGRRTQAMLVCQQINSATAFEEMRFVGFYTFSPGLIRRMHADLLDVARGRSAALREFLRLQALDLAAKQMRREFLREEQAVFSAMRRLQFDSRRYRPIHFAMDFEKGLSRLHRWKTRLPEMVARAEAS